MAGLFCVVAFASSEDAARGSVFPSWLHVLLCHARRLLNLELLLKFGPDSWRMHNEALSSFVTRLQEQLAAVKRQVGAFGCALAGPVLVTLLRAPAGPQLGSLCTLTACVRCAQPASLAPCLARVGMPNRERKLQQSSVPQPAKSFPSPLDNCCLAQVGTLSRERKLQQPSVLPSACQLLPGPASQLLPCAGGHTEPGAQAAAARGGWRAVQAGGRVPGAGAQGGCKSGVSVMLFALHH